MKLKRGIILLIPKDLTLISPNLAERRCTKCVGRIASLTKFDPKSFDYFSILYLYTTVHNLKGKD